MEQLIYTAISNAMAEIGVIGKDSKNQQQGFKYRGIDAVMNALQPVLVKNKIFAIPEVLEQTREEKTTKNGGNLTYTILKVKYTFYALDGSNVSAIVIGEGMDSADKSSNKAMSIAFKYACFQILCIPTEETNPDPDADAHDIISDKPNPLPASSKKEVKDKPESTQKKPELTPQQYVSAMKKQKNVSDTVLFDYIGEMFSKNALTDCTKDECTQIYEWLKTQGGQND